MSDLLDCFVATTIATGRSVASIRHAIRVVDLLGVSPLHFAVVQRWLSNLGIPGWVIGIIILVAFVGYCLAKAGVFTGPSLQQGSVKSSPATKLNWGLIIPCCFAGLVAFGAYRAFHAANADPKQQLVAIFTDRLNSEKQKVFNALHPVGTANSIVVHEVNVIGATAGQKHAEIRFTVFWSGPVTSDGFTKVRVTYDPEIGRYIDHEILATNGLTNAQTKQMGIDFLTGFLEGMVQGMNEEGGRR
jgi:hypothetical protein